MKKGIHVCAWSPLGAYKVFWGSNAVMENPILQEIAEARKKSVAQVQAYFIFQTIFNDNFELHCLEQTVLKALTVRQKVSFTYLKLSTNINTGKVYLDSLWRTH
jgi:diketogulonate reductase-like aldo/keto reductase